MNKKCKYGKKVGNHYRCTILMDDYDNRGIVCKPTRCLIKEGE